MSIQVLPEETAPLRLVESWRARLAVAGAAVLCRMSPEKLNHMLCQITGNRPQAPEALCERARTAVCTVSLSCRGPKGCLKRSVATILMCRMAGVSATWCTGFSLSPFRAHAWVEIDDRPVGEHDEVADYIVVLSTSPARTGGHVHE